MEKKINRSQLLGIDQKTKHIWLQSESSILYASADQILETRIIQSLGGGFNIYAKINLIYRFEDYLLDIKKTLAAAKKFVEEFMKELRKEEFIKNLKGTTFIKKNFVMGFSVVNSDLVALITNSPIPVVLASYATENDALEALEYYISNGTYKSEKIKLDESSLTALNSLVEEIKHL